MGAEYIETLRERLIYLREILSNDGAIFIRMDYHFGHYIKIIADEVFGRENFLNEIIINRTNKQWEGVNRFNSATDSLFLYSKTQNYSFNTIYRKRQKETKWINAHSPGIRYPRERKFNGKVYFPPEGRHWTFNQETMDKYVKDDRIMDKNGILQYLQSDLEVCTSNWTDIPGYSSTMGYPTENSESVLERVINACSNSDDLVLDCFAGSGTTAAVAEKLGRRWIMCDFGKHAIYTMQKRIWNIAASKKLGQEAKENEKYGQPPQPFSIISAGVYDFSRIMNLRKNKEAYINFVLGLFSIIREEKDYISKYKLSNIYAEKDNNPVEVYPIWDDEYLKEVRIDEDYLKEIIRSTGGRLKGDYYIVTPESCTVITNTTLKNGNNEDINFKLLKFPYKILEDVSRHFQIKDQPASTGDINQLISSAGFYFNEEIEIAIEKIPEGFKIKHFSSGILNQNKERYEGLEGLSMILIDKNYDGQVFNLDQAIYKNEISEEGIVKIQELTEKSYLIAIDKHGNESKIIKI
jgi:DNA modification methylase